MKNLSTLILAFFLRTFTYAQQAPIMVCNPAGTSCAPYYTLNEAYTAASTDDYIYIPGGTFQLDSTIKKKINIIGAGFHTDSSLATGRTIISGQIKLGQGCNNSTFEGFYLIGEFLHNNTIGNLEINGLSIKKCNFNGLTMPASTATFNNTLILQCVVRDNLNFAPWNSAISGNNNTIQNCFTDIIINTNNSTISNCILNNNYNGDVIIFGCKNTTIKNSIFGSANISNYNITGNGSTNITFLNNANYSSQSLCGGSPNCTQSNNLSFNCVPQDLFNFACNAALLFFDEYRNYHLTNTSAQTGGIGGTQIGIYGGSTPWIDGVIPSNPHIYFKNISNATNPNGELPAQIKVRIGN